MRIAAFIPFLVPGLALAFPPGTPMSDIGPAQVSLGLFFEHGGLDLYEESAPAVLNTAGLGAEYAPWPYLQVGVFGGGAEFDVGVPDSRVSDTSVHSFNSSYQFFGGVSGKLATPRFLTSTTRFVAFGSAAYLNNDDDHENIKRGIFCDAGASVQVLAFGRLNFVLGGEYLAMAQGEQESPTGKVESFGLSQPGGEIDHVRGLLGVEYYFKGKNQPFISVSYRSGAEPGWDDKLGLRGGSIAVSLGAIASLPGKGKSQVQEEEPGLSEE